MARWGEEDRPRRDERPQHQVVPLATLAETRKPLRRSVHELLRERSTARRLALDETRPHAFFASIWTTWTSVRKVKEGETTIDLFAFLTTEPNAIVAPIHAKAMPVILTTSDEIEEWMTAPR